MVSTTRLTGAQAAQAHQVYRLSLPLALAARLAALGELHPHKTPEALLTDLVALGLSEIERQWPGRPEQSPDFHPDTRLPVYLVTGPFAAFHGLMHKHHLALEQAQAQAKEDPQTNASPNDYSLGEAD
jgi:hypothetical protein